jgi:hypothetical protein
LNIDFTCEQHEKSTEISASLQVIFIVVPGVSLTMVHTSIWNAIMPPPIQEFSNDSALKKKLIEESHLY